MEPRRRSILALAALCVLAALGAVWLSLREERREVATETAAAREAAAAPVQRASAPDGVDDARATVAASPAPIEQPTAPTPAVATGLRTIRITVTDEDGTPLAGARVERTAPTRAPALFADSSGKCALQVEPNLDTVQILFTAEHCMHSLGYWSCLPELSVRLRRTVALRGRVLDAESHVAIPRARVSLIHDSCRHCPPDVCVAEQDGSFRLDGVPRAKAMLRIDVEGYPAWQRSVDFETTGDEAARDFPLPRGSPLRGRVVDFTTGLALPAATIGDGTSTWTADAGGAFDAPVLPSQSGSFVIKVTAEGRCTLHATITNEELAGAGELELRLPQSPVIEGTVRDPEGQPLAGTHVNVRTDFFARARAQKNGAPEPESPLSQLPGTRQYRDSEDASATTDATGAFRVSGLVPWQGSHELVAGGDGFQASRVAIERLPGPGEPLQFDVRLQRAPVATTGSVRGRIWANGVAAPGVVTWTAGERTGEVPSSLHGGYSTGELPPGSVTLRGRITGYAGAVAGDSATVEIKAGQAVRQELELQLPPATIRGRVQFVGGRPAAGAEVLLLGESTEYGRASWLRTGRETNAGDDGSFALDVADYDVVYRVIATFGAASAVRDGVRPGAQDVLLELSESGKLVFRAVDAATGQEVEPKWLRCFARSSGNDGFEDVRMSASSSGESGWITQNFVAGPLDLLVFAGEAGFTSARASTLIVPGSEARLEVQLHAGLTAQFRRDQASDARWNAHQVYVMEPENWAAVRTWRDGLGNHFDGGPAFPGFASYERLLLFDAEGNASIKCLTPGKYRFRILPDDAALEPDSFGLTESASEPIVLRWKP